MGIARLAWSLPILAAGLLVAQVVQLVESGAPVPLWVLLGAVDVVLAALVVHLFRALRRGGPLTLTTTLLGMFCLGIVAGEVFPGDPDRHPVALVLRFGLQAAAFVLTAWAWVRGGNRRESGSLRTFLAIGLLGFLGVWALLAFAGLGRTPDAFALRLLGLLGLVAPMLAYFVHLAWHLSRRVRLSDGMLLAGLFLVLPAGYVGPVVVLGKWGYPSAMLWLYFGVVAFAAMAIAWSKGEKAGTPSAGATAALLCVAAISFQACGGESEEPASGPPGDPAPTVDVEAALVRGRRATAANQIREIESAIALFYVDHGRHPDSLDELTGDHSEHGFPDGYLTEIPRDPWGEVYVYDPVGGSRRPYRVSSKGADRIEGTDDDLESE